ncbi:MAG: helix-hairpin-helix domain-containing protein [Vicingaceae bacterium]
MNQQIKDYFHFSRIERRGILALVFIISILLSVNLYVKYAEPNYTSTSGEKLARVMTMIDSLEQEEARKQQLAEIDTFKVENERSELKRFNFNPNQLSLEKWMALGLSQKQAEVIKKYEASGGSFRVKSDVQKMYTVSDEMYQELKPFILLPDTLEKKNYGDSNESASEQKKSYTKKKEWKKIVLDVNVADSASLTKLYGIGPYFSGKIVSYREELGGYHSLEQLTELWGVEDNLIQSLDSQLVLKKVKLRKLKVNKMDAGELKSHPYLSWNVANSIVSIREKHGKYQALEDLKKSVLINDSLLQKLKPYLSLEE